MTITQFQCSSASRKFLKFWRIVRTTQSRNVSVLFSEPKIPQTRIHGTRRSRQRCFSALQRAENSSNVQVWWNDFEVVTVSVLFSEPKIPQTPLRCSISTQTTRFQCSSASRKFLKLWNSRHRRDPYAFQCSSASRKFLKVL